MKILLLVLFVFLITNNIFQSIIPGLNYFDEGLTIWALILSVSIHHKKQFVQTDKNILYSIGIVVLIGVVSTSIYHIQPNFDGVWRDFLAIIKFPLCYCIYNNYISSNAKEIALRQAVKFSNFFIYVLVFFGIVNLVSAIPIFNNGERYGFPLYGFLYSHNTFMITAVVGMLGVFMADGIAKHRRTIICAVIVLILSFRSKAMPIAFAVILILLTKKDGRKLQISKLGFGILISISIFIALYLSTARIDEYIYYADMTARGALYINGIDVANRYFPLGSGFCSFASSLAGKYYSPLYYNYNMQYIIGLMEDDYSYAADTFWPNIYAQYGYIGFCAYLMMIFYVFKSISKRFLYFTDKWIGAMILFFYILSASMAESFFTNDSSVIFAVILSVYLGKNTKCNDENIRTVSIVGPRRC